MAKVLFGVYLVIAVATFVWGFWVVGGVRERARTTDGALRLVAWQCLCYAQSGQAGEGKLWPESVDALVAFAARNDCQTSALQSDPWPASKVDALAGMTAPDSLERALELVQVEFAPDGLQAPHISARGNPSGVDTLEVVNGWLIAYASIPPLGRK